MNKKSITLLILLSIGSIVSCFSIQYSVDNSFKNIDVKFTSKYHKPGISKEIKDENKDQAKEIRKFLNLRERQKYFYDNDVQKKKPNTANEIHSLEVQLKIKDPKTGRDIYLTKRRYNPLQGDVPCGIYFEERFMFHNKLARIMYTVSIDCIYKEGKHSIESVEVTIIDGSVGGRAWPEKTSKEKLSSLL